METINAVADTSFVVALVNEKDAHHLASKKAYASQRQILLPQTVLAEVAYLLGRDAGIPVLTRFLRSLSSSRFQLLSLVEQDITNIADILDRYRDSRIDFVDASVIVVAERYYLVSILTLDRRDFSLYQPQHCPAFILTP